MSNFLNNFYGTLFSPIETFSRLKENPPLLLFFDISLVFRIIFGLISWLFLASFFESLARIFKRQGGMKIFLTLSAFALLPGYFLALLNYLKQQEC